MLAAGSGTDPSVSQVAPNAVFMVTVRNNQGLLDRCLRSVARQRYPNTRCIVIDDASEDGTAGVARKWERERPETFAVQVSPNRRGKMPNIFDAVHALDPHDVVVELDGDDRLLSPDAAGDLARLHMRLDLVWTQHRVSRHRWRDWPHFRSTDLPPAYRNLVELPRLRWSRTWHPSHLRSFKAWAFHQLDPSDLMIDGEWVQASADYAYFTPLVEMTPPVLRYFYDRELAVYNITGQNEKRRERQAVPPIFRQGYVVDQLASRSAFKSRSSPIWIGLVDADNRAGIKRAWEDQIKTTPATRFLLVSEFPLLESWHPRVQVIAQHTIARSDVPPADRARGAVRWLEQYAAELGHSSGRARPVPELPLWQLP